MMLHINGILPIEEITIISFVVKFRFLTRSHCHYLDVRQDMKPDLAVSMLS